MDWGTIAQWAGVASANLIAIYGAMSSRRDKQIEDLKKNTKESVDELKTDRNLLFERVDELATDMAAVKAELDHVPTKDEFHALDKKVERIVTILETTTPIMQRLQQLFLEREAVR